DAKSHGLRILVSQLEYVPDLDGLDHFQRFAASLARVARHHLAQILELRRKILTWRDVAQVVIILVRAGDHVPASLDRGVGQDRHVRDPDWTERPGVRSEPFANLVRMCRAYFARAHGGGEL